MKIREMEIEKIIPYENNPRKNDAAVEKVAASIREFGWQQPIVVDQDMVVIAGHTRLKAAQLLRLKTAPVVVADMLTDEQVKAYRLADNKTAEFSEWDPGALDLELFDISDIDMTQFGFDQTANNAWFDRTEHDGTQRQSDNDEYNAFLDKFEPKKTTDDCYTPDNIYEALASWAENEYGINRMNFIRPFYPGGDYRRHKYGKNDIVVDNPPFSILAEIVDFYIERSIRFLLFAPGLSTLNYVNRENVCAICTYANITYENGASVTTSFLTNLGDGSIIALSCPTLYEAIEEANDENEKAMRVHLPKYEYPVEVLTAAKFGWLAKYGQRMEIRRDESIMIRQLDDMKESGKGIYGNALLLSERAAAERAAAERAAAERAAAERAAAERAATQVWKLSEREKEIVRSLGAENAEKEELLDG